MDLSYPITYLKEYPHQRAESREKWTIDVKKITSKWSAKPIQPAFPVLVCVLTHFLSPWSLMNGHLLVAGNRTWWSWTSRARRPMAMCGLQLLVKVRDILKWRCQLNLHSMLCFARLHKLQAKPNGQQIVKPIWLSPAWVGNCFPLRVLAKRFCMTLNWQLEQVHTSETIIKTGIMCSHLVVHSNPSIFSLQGGFQTLSTIPAGRWWTSWT